ncbi:GGDEF domain-containing protein [Desulfovibrio sp. SGI.169]|uniref:GGDEF domain-containing protein n=1 Tax=Desulfovibrio sp. SGI.169 TaxID=3420561 RepID=UPI003CFC175F
MEIERKKSVHDSMTGLLNRRGYMMFLESYNKRIEKENFVYVAMDLNGLKHANDTMGHAAGDELLRAAAHCMAEVFGPYGKVFRTGGDEFAATIHVDEAQLKQIKTFFEKITSVWQGDYIQGVSVSCGYVQGKEFPDKTLAEIVDIADKRMYMAKEEYYRTHERRGRGVEKSAS